MSEKSLSQRLIQVCRPLSTRQRLRLASELRIVIDSICRSRSTSQPLSRISGLWLDDEPNQKPLGKAPRGYILVNIDKREAERIRALAQCHWTGVQGALRDALMDKMDDLERELGISAEQAVKMSKTKRAAFRSQHKELRPKLMAYSEGPQLCRNDERWLLSAQGVRRNRQDVP